MARKNCGALVCERAEELCHGTTPRLAVPIRSPRWAWATTALALVALGMLGVRYGVRHSLDLRPPIAQSAIEFFRPLWFQSEPPEQAPQQAPSLPPQTELAVYTEGDRAGEDRPVLEPPPPDGASLFEDEEIPVDGQDLMEESLLDDLRNAFEELMDKLGVSKEELTKDKEGSEEGGNGGGAR